jgi:hypothetical protein
MKTMFVWEYVDGLTCNYHSSGGCLVIADDKDKALQLLADYGVGSSCEVFKTDPNYSAPMDSDAVEDRVFIFPDAGCC